MAPRTPAPMRVSSQTGPELNMQITASAPRAAAAASHACATPNAESASALAVVRFQAVALCPAWAMRRAHVGPHDPSAQEANGQLWRIRSLAGRCGTIIHDDHP